MDKYKNNTTYVDKFNWINLTRLMPPSKEEKPNHIMWKQWMKFPLFAAHKDAFVSHIVPSTTRTYLWTHSESLTQKLN